MRSLFEHLVVDWTSGEPPAALPRRQQLWSVPGSIDAVVGPRRAGKTWLLHRRARELVAQGVPKDHILYVNFEDERLASLRAEDLGLLLEVHGALHPHTIGQERWLFLDEIHNVPGWDRFVRRLADQASLHVAVTGSSARLLSTEIATSLRGRALTTELLPLAFDEFLTFRGVTPPSSMPPDESGRARLAAALREYLMVGGYPSVLTLDDRARRETLGGYVDVAILRDVVERHQVGQVAALRWLVRRLIGSPGGAFSVHKAHADLRSQGLSIGKDTLHELVQHVQDAFLAFLVPIWSESVQVRTAHPRKVYLADHGLARSFWVRDQPGHTLENVVYLELRRRGEEIGWWRTDGGFELDFVAVRDGRLQLVQVCDDVSDPATLGRELRATAAAMGELEVREATVVTVADHGEHHVPEGTITVVPAWRWLLERTDR